MTPGPIACHRLNSPPPAAPEPPAACGSVSQPALAGFVLCSHRVQPVADRFRGASCIPSNTTSSPTPPRRTQRAIMTARSPRSWAPSTAAASSLANRGTWCRWQTGFGCSASFPHRMHWTPDTTIPTPGPTSSGCWSSPGSRRASASWVKYWSYPTAVPARTPTGTC